MPPANRESTGAAAPTSASATRGFRWQKSVEAGVGRQLAGLRRQLEENVGTSRLRLLTEAAWRQLNNPIGIASASKMWLRGEPVSLEFAGLEFNGEEVDVRTAIMAELATYEGGRPLPLIARKAPPLALSTEARGKPAIVVPVEIGYGEVAAAMLRALPGGGVLPPRNADEEELKIRSLELFPSKTHIAMGVEIEARQRGKLEGYKGRAYLVALPQLDPIDGSVRLSKLVMTDSAGAPRALDGTTPVVDPARVEALFADQKLMQLEPLIARARAKVSGDGEHSMAEGLRLRRRLHEARVGSLALLADAIRVNVELQGDLTVVYDAANLAVESIGNPPVGGP